MSLTIPSQKLIAQNGKYVVLPPAMGGQNLSDISLPTDICTPDDKQKYPLGTKFVSGLRKYFYCKTNGTCYPQMGAYKAKKTNTVAVAPTQSTAAELVAAGYANQTLNAGADGSYFVTVTIDTEIGVLTTGGSW
jgi:hypothetical protein